MKIIFFDGGLGNQAFQYIFGRALEIATGETVLFDDSFFYIKMMNKFKHSEACDTSINMRILDKVFNMKFSTLSSYFSGDVWNYMIECLSNEIEPYMREQEEYLGFQCAKKYSIPQQLRNAGMDLTLIAETDNFAFDGNVVFTPANAYNPIILQARGNIYYHGYWINKWWFWNNKDLIRKEFTIPEITDEVNLNYLNQIKQTISVAVHIRYFYKWKIPNEYYQSAINKFRKKFPKAVFFVFSDNLDDVKKKYKEYGFKSSDKIVFVTGNESPDANYRDMQLMSLCKHMIMSNSSMSYLAYLLNTNQNISVTNPTTRET